MTHALSNFIYPLLYLLWNLTNCDFSFFDNGQTHKEALCTEPVREIYIDWKMFDQHETYFQYDSSRKNLTFLLKVHDTEKSTYHQLEVNFDDWAIKDFNFEN